MIKWFRHKILGPHAAAVLRRANRSATTAIRLSAASLALWTAPHVCADQPEAPAREESVLVATREAPAAGSAAAQSAPSTDGDALQPVAESSDHTPDLATNEDKYAPAEAEATEAVAPVAPEAQPTEISQAAPEAPADQDAEVSPGVDSSDPAAQATATENAAADGEPFAFAPVKFQGILVGKSTRQELITAWGAPLESIATNEGTVLFYKKLPFQAIEALMTPDDVVSTIKITLASPLDADKLAEQLSLAQFDPAVVMDEAGHPLGQAFPESGVLFMFATSDSVTPIDDDGAPAANSTTVSHVVLQPVDATSFALRAENRLDGPYAQNISDLKTAIALDPEFAHAYWLLAKIYLATGQAELADAITAHACEMEPTSAAFQLFRGQTLELAGKYDEAVLTVRAVLDREDLASLDRAQGLHQMARLASLGDVEIASKTIPFETRAIEIADKLATSKNRSERLAAKQLLVQAHMGIAEEVARQSYNQKVESLSQWVGRTSGLAEDFIAHDGGSIELRLFIAQRVLVALASFKPSLDPAPWVAEAEEAANTLCAQSDDELWQQRIKWDLGIAYLNALRVEHTRRQTDAAVRYGELAIENLAAGASSRQAVHASEQLVGQLYFQMGAVYAVHKLDHPKAAQWYEKAAPILTAERPASELYAPRREGEMLVSMGVTYWQLGEQTRALELTQSGVALVEAAVENGILAKSTLAVPYGNLATMYQQMGENDNAAKYAELAKSVATAQAKRSVQLTRRPAHQSRTR